MRRFAWLVPGLLAAGSVVGCTKPMGPVPVHGKVYYRGAPLGNGVIVLTPDGSRGSHGPFAQAEIQAEGSYEMKTGSSPGAPAGWYRVTIVAVDTKTPALSLGGFSVPRTLLPEKYRDPELSGLVCEIKPGQANQINFNLD